VVTGLAWLLLEFVPLKAAEVGPFARGLLTPARAEAMTRRAHPDASWPMFGATPARARYVSSGLRPPFRLLYTISGEGLIEMPPVVARGLVVFGTHDGLVIATRAGDGGRAWTASIGGCIASSPAVWGRVVVVGWASPAPCGRDKGERGGVVALDLTSGEILWRFRAGNVESSPAIVNGTLFVSAFAERELSTV
jgi:outer membrane protein assembly factor BamB